MPPTDEIVGTPRRAGRSASLETNDPRGATKEIRRLSSLIEISQALAATLNLSVALPQALDILERHHRVVRSAITLLDEETGELTIKVSSGLSPEGQRARYRLGEGITGRVVESGKPIVVPEVSREPLLLNRAARRHERQELTFICVPLVITRKVVGALSVDLLFRRDRDYDRSLKFYKLVASMVSQAIKVSRMAEAERRRLVEENTHLKDELRDRFAFQHLIGTSAPIRQVYDQVAQVARTNTTVLVRGESGTGKEMIAHAVHYNSARARKPFIKVSCAALPESLIESELFGYERGAFTGAHGQKKGRFELADGGTLFLDEIGDLTLTTQVKLLRVLQEREFERLGGTQSVRVNVRLIAATHRPLEKLIGESLFREDLFYRLNVFTVYAPAAARAEARHHAPRGPFPREILDRAQQVDQADLDAGHRHAHQLSLAGQRPRAREHHRTVRPGVRRRRHPRPPPPADAADRGSVRHRLARGAVGSRLGVREGPDPGRAQVHPRQPRPRRQAARHDRAHPELQGPEVRHRRGALPVVIEDWSLTIDD